MSELRWILWASFQALSFQQWLMRNIGADLSTATIPSLQHPYAQVGLSPYGILWYGIMYPVYWLSMLFQSLPGPVALALAIWLVNLPVTIVLFQKYLPLAILYTILILHSWASKAIWITEWNMPIAWLTLLGLIHPILLVLPIMAKLPVGAPLSVWQYDLQTRTPSQIYSYIPLGLLWLMILAMNVWKDTVWRRVKRDRP